MFSDKLNVTHEPSKHKKKWRNDCVQSINTWTKSHESTTATHGLPPLVVILAGLVKIPEIRKPMINKANNKVMTPYPSYGSWHTQYKDGNTILQSYSVIDAKHTTPNYSQLIDKINMTVLKYMYIAFIILYYLRSNSYLNTFSLLYSLLSSTMIMLWYW